MAWGLSFDNNVDGGDPINDMTGEFQNEKQNFPVFMLGGATTTGVERAFLARPEKPFLIPLITTSCVSSNGFDCNDPGVVEFVDQLLDNVNSLFLTVDGTLLISANTVDEVDQIEAEFRYRTPNFDVEVAPNNWAGESAGIWPNSYQAGYFAFIDLPVGEHRISFGGSRTGSDPFSNSVDATITVVPIPAALPLFAGALAGLGVVAWRKGKAAEWRAPTR